MCIYTDGGRSVVEWHVSVPIGFDFLFTDIGGGGPLVVVNLKELGL